MRPTHMHDQRPHDNHKYDACFTHLSFEISHHPWQDAEMCYARYQGYPFKKAKHLDMQSDLELSHAACTMLKQPYN